ncbi:SDR family NAD(P)-dependent oxidoreductase [Nocardia rhizosphaerihabitans]|uniref:Short-chain dehydrogenase n=1 Tax=Nocardia rhizosphaerihabitans TaxID=1691570 RepID=A0ABQ2L3G7_9NOCA|nr:SDR family NAD(P)-dependent oxidoreductase [Nocardia rhizosphaerihabitans]GGN99390.1 hypothetical protein GCM10011610_67290 [Nocardia rhizosphaerihabitans]
MKVAVVGSSAGLGAAVALRHARRDDDVVAVARRGDRLKQLAESTPPRAGKWVSVTADVTSPEGLAACLEASAGCDRIYLTAAVNAGIRHTIALNFEAHCRIAEALDRRGLQVVAISSLAAVVAFPDLEVYGASKAALEQWFASHSRTAESDLLIVRPGRFASEFHTGPLPFDPGSLPHGRAAEVVAAADSSRSGTVTLGGVRDRIAVAVSRIFGPVHALGVL